MKTGTILTKKEVIVVLFSIVFLLANIAAVGSGGRARAKEAACRANLKKWGIVYSMYANDNHGYFPYPCLGAITYPYSFAHGWWVVLKNYFKDYNLMFCPSATKIAVNSGGTGVQPFSAWRYGQDATTDPVTPYVGSYGVNAWIFSWEGDMGSRFGSVENEAWRWKRMDVKGPENIPLMADCASVGGKPLAGDIPYPDQQMAGEYVYPPTHGYMGKFCIDRHNGGINVVFADGSVRKVGLKKLWQLKWHRQFDTTSGPAEGEWPQWIEDCCSQ